MSEWSHSILKDDDTNRDFAHHLGYAILNCGVLENLTYSYAATLNKTHFFDTGLTKKLFSERKKLVLDSLEKANLDVETRNRASDLWNEATEIMNVRNIVAHNPINHVVVNSKQQGAKTLVGVVDMAKSTPTNIVSLDATKLSNLANRASELADMLESCLLDIQREQTSD